MKILHEDIMRAKVKHMPIKIMKFNKCKHKHSTWITQGLLKSKIFSYMHIFNVSKLCIDNQHGLRQKHSTEYVPLDLVDRMIKQKTLNMYHLN